MKASQEGWSIREREGGIHLQSLLFMIRAHVPCVTTTWDSFGDNFGLEDIYIQNVNCLSNDISTCRFNSVAHPSPAE